MANIRATITATTTTNVDTDGGSSKRREAMRIRFLRNHNVRFEGVFLTVSHREHRTFEKLLESVTRALHKCPAVRLPSAVCQLRHVDGIRITCVDQLINLRMNYIEEAEDACAGSATAAGSGLGSGSGVGTPTRMPTVIACCRNERFRCLDYKVLKTPSQQTVPLLMTLTEARMANHSYTRLHRTVCPSSVYENMPLAMLMPRTLRYSYTTCRRLPNGHSGAVLVLRHAVTRQRLVLKVMEIKSRDQRELNECRILQQLQGHPQIINLMVTEITTRAIYIIVEAMDMDLMDFKRAFRHITETQVTYVMRQIIEGLVYIHSMDIVHRDIKLDNILVRLNGRSTLFVPEIKIADYGLACTCTEDQLLYDFVGTEKFIAPEIYTKVGYNKTVDCYSAGVTFQFLTTNHYPTENHHIDKPVIESFINWKSCCDLINHMLRTNPDQRWTSKELLRHRFIADKFNKR